MSDSFKVIYINSIYLEVQRLGVSFMARENQIEQSSACLTSGCSPEYRLPKASLKPRGSHSLGFEFFPVSHAEDAKTTRSPNLQRPVIAAKYLFIKIGILSCS